MGTDLLVCDLDGTLVDGSLEIAPVLLEALRAARARGLRLSLATGRMPPGAARYRDALELVEPLIFYNGALVRDHVGGRDLLALTLPRGLLARAWRVVADAPVHPLFYRDDRLYAVGRTYAVRQYADEQGLALTIVDEPDSFLRLGAFVKALLIGHPADLAVVRAELEGVVGADARLVATRTDYLELIPAGASKGAALRHLAAHLGVPAGRVVAVGDQENDLEMLTEAGHGIAMAHAPERVRRAARRVAPPGPGGLLGALAEALPAYFR